MLITIAGIVLLNVLMILKLMLILLIISAYMSVGLVNSVTMIQICVCPNVHQLLISTVIRIQEDVYISVLRVVMLKMIPESVRNNALQMNMQTI